MKNLMIYFLALTCVTANAQYNQTRSESSPLLMPATKQGSIVSSYDSPGLKIPYHLLANSATTTRVALTNFNTSPATQMPGTGNYWSGSVMTTKTGAFQTTNYFDQMGNLRNTNTSFTFKKRKK